MPPKIEYWNLKQISHELVVYFESFVVMPTCLESETFEVNFN